MSCSTVNSYVIEFLSYFFIFIRVAILWIYPVLHLHGCTTNMTLPVGDVRSDCDLDIANLSLQKESLSNVIFNSNSFSSSILFFHVFSHDVFKV